MAVRGQWRLPACVTCRVPAVHVQLWFRRPPRARSYKGAGIISILRGSNRELRFAGVANANVVDFGGRPLCGSGNKCPCGMGRVCAGYLFLVSEGLACHEINVGIVVRRDDRLACSLAYAVQALRERLSAPLCAFPHEPLETVARFSSFSFLPSFKELDSYASNDVA